LLYIKVKKLIRLPQVFTTNEFTFTKKKKMDFKKF